MKKIIFLFFCLPFIAPVFAQNLYDLEHIPIIKITFSEKNWSQKLDSLKNAGGNERIAATVEIDGKPFGNVGVRYKGNSSYKNPLSKGQKKLPFNLKADYVDKNQSFPGGYETLKLSNVFQDPSYLREVLSYEIARKYIPAPLVNFAKVYVNGEYLGLYNNTQSIDEKFLNDAFGASDNTFFKCDPEWEEVKNTVANCRETDKASLMYAGDDPACYAGWYELQSKNPDGWKELIRLTKLLQFHPERLDTVMNIDRVLWMHAFNNVLVNLDSYTGRLSHNYYLYKTPDGLLTPIVWDMNISFGGFRYDGEKPGALTDEELQQYSLFAHYKNKNAKRPLITNVLANALWRKIYVGHCYTILQENFVNGDYLKLAEKVRTLIDAEVKNDPNKLYAYEDFKSNLKNSVDVGQSNSIGLEELMKPRTAHLLLHPLFSGKIPVISDVKYVVTGDKITFTAQVQNGLKTWLAWRSDARQRFQFSPMKMDGATAATTVDGKAGLQYYILTEGDKMALSAPARAAWEFYEVP